MGFNQLTGHKCHGTDPKKRLECGYLGIKREECEDARGCCYDDNVPGVPYCFRGKDMQGRTSFESQVVSEKIIAYLKFCKKV